MNTKSSALNVLFLCTHNSGRSIMAEAVLNHLGNGRFKAFSAGSNPTSDQKPNTMALKVLQDAGFAIDGLTSKSWDVFDEHVTPHMDLVITVCDDVAGIECPVWSGHPAIAHWGMPDPSLFDGNDDEKIEAFRQSLHHIARKLALLINLPANSTNRLALEQHLLDIAIQ